MIGLRYFRLEQHLTQKQLGKRAGVDHAIISLIENERLKPLPHELDKLAAALEVVPPHTLLAPVGVLEPMGVRP